MPSNLDTYLQQRRAIAAAATEGPWQLCVHLRDENCPCGGRGTRPTIWSADGHTIIVFVAEQGMGLEEGADLIDAHQPSRGLARANAIHIADARVAVPVLCGMVTAYRSALDRLMDTTAHYCQCHDTKGGGHIDTGRAWDAMRRAESNAYAAIVAVERMAEEAGK